MKTLRLILLINIIRSSSNYLVQSEKFKEIIEKNSTEYENFITEKQYEPSYIDLLNIKYDELQTIKNSIAKEELKFSTQSAAFLSSNNPAIFNPNTVRKKADLEEHINDVMNLTMNKEKLETIETKLRSQINELEKKVYVEFKKYLEFAKEKK